MSNSKELKVKYHGNKEKPSRTKNPNVASMSKLGYRDDSPYNTLPYIDIHTPSGRIDMSGTGIPLWANGRILPPYSGVHQFDTTEVKEIPLAKKGGSWLEQYQDKKSIVDTVKAKYASRPSSASPEKQPEIVLNVPKTLTAQKSTTDTGINKKNIESELEVNSRYVSPGSYGKGEIFTENYINKLKKDYNVDLEYDPADPFFRIAGLFGNPPGAYYNPFTRTINYGTEFGYEELDPETHPYVRHDMLMHEIPHAIQFDRHKSVIGKLGEARHMLSGLFMGQDARYDTPGTFEHEAHHILEKKLRKDFDKAWDEWDGETVRRKGGSWLNKYE